LFEPGQLMMLQLFLKWYGLTTSWISMIGPPEPCHEAMNMHEQQSHTGHAATVSDA
jgi:hypothetical protein